jgi:O-antigen ligase
MKSNLALSKPRYVLLFLLLMVTVAVDCFFVENHAWFNNGARNEPNIYEYYFLFALCLLMSGAFLYAAHTMGKAKVSYPFLIALGVLFFSDIIAIVFFPGIYDTGELMYLPDAVTKVRYILGFSITCVGLYCVLGIAPQILRNKSTLDVFFLLLVLLASTAVIYSVIKEFDLYKAMIVSGGPEDAYAVPSSFTSNRNVYARLLFYGLMAECYLQCKNPHWWRYLIVLVFFLFECVTLSKISVAMSCFFIGAFLIYRFFASWKTHQTRNSVWFMIVLVALVTLVVGYFSGLFADHLPKLWAILDKTKDALGNSLQASFEARLYSWTDILRMIQKSPLNLWFGYGDYNMQQAYATIEELPVVDSVSPFDGAYILILTKNGILGLMMAGLFVVYLLWLIIASLKRGSHTAWASLLMLASFLGLGIFESVSFFGFTSLCMVMLGMVVLPLLTDEYNARHPYRENLMIAAYASSPEDE